MAPQSDPATPKAGEAPAPKPAKPDPTAPGGAGPKSPTTDPAAGGAAPGAAGGAGGPKSPEPAAHAGGLTLDQVINATLLADPKIRAGLESVTQAGGDAVTASLKPNPTLTVYQSLLPLVQPFTVDRTGGPPQFDLGVGYPVDWFLFGKRAAAMQAAGLGVRVSEADYADRVRTRVLEAGSAFYDVQEARALLDIARQDADNLARLEGVTRTAVANGGRPAVDLSRIRLDRLRAEQVTRDAETARVTAVAKLRAVMGRGDADPGFEVADAGEPAPADPLPVEEGLAVATRNRPDIQSSRWKLAQAQATAEVQRRQAYPLVTARTGYTRQYQSRAIGAPDASSFGYGFDTSLPFNDRNQGNRLKAASQVAQSSYTLQADLNDLRAEVEQTTRELTAAAQTARAVAGEQLTLAGTVRDSIGKAYEAGGRPLIDVLDAQRNYRDTYRLFIASRAGYGRAVLKYGAALGKQVRP